MFVHPRAEGAMIVQRIVMPTSGVESWTVIDDDFAPVAPAEAYLAYLAPIERSPNTVRAYASSLKLWFEFLGVKDVSWDAAGVETVASFVSWLRAPADNVIVLDAGAARRSETTVNRHLAALFSFYDYHAHRLGSSSRRQRRARVVLPAGPDRADGPSD